MCGIYSVAAGIKAMESGNFNAQITAAVEGIELAPSIVTLTQSTMDKVTADSLQYATDTVMSVRPDEKYDPNGDLHKGGGAHMVAAAAIDNLNKTIDQQRGDLDISHLQNILKTIQSVVSFLGKNLENVFEVERPQLEFMTQQSSLIRGF